MYELLCKLFPINRSITGDGVRKTLKIINEIVPLNIYEIPSGEKCFDWVIPDEWNVTDAYVKNSKGEKIIDFKRNNLHLVSYSIPFKGKVELKELKKHIYSIPELPDAIPYITSYYERRWGFCIKHNQYKKLKNDTYEVVIDSTLKPGSLTYADLLIKGRSKKEIVLSTYICHPSMANNELSGPVISTYLAKYLLEKRNLNYSYRFIFVPETIGSIAYLSKKLNHLQKYCFAGYVVTCAGSAGHFSYLSTPNEDQLVDKVTKHVLKYSKKEYKLYNFLERGSDERQYCSPLVNLPIGSLMRSKYHTYKEYHTSLDNLEFVSSDALNDSFDLYSKCLEALENNFKYKSTNYCEPQLGKYNLIQNIGTRNSFKDGVIMKTILAYGHGKGDLIDIAEKLKISVFEVFPIAKNLIEKKLIKKEQYRIKN